MPDSETAAPNTESAVNAPGDDRALFYELVSQPTIHRYRIVRPDAPSTPVYYIEKHKSLSKNTFDLILHEGDSKHGDVLGVVKLHPRGFTFGLGDPAADKREGEEMIWEESKRPKTFSHRVHQFDFGTGAQRRTYTYRKSYSVLKRLKGIELRAGGVEEEEAEGPVLAKWVGGKSKWTMKAGSLLIRRTGMEDRNQDVPSDEKAKKWEVMVCLTTFGIIESQLKRRKV